MPELALHQPTNRPWSSPNLSPFCTKLETYFRMTDTKYTVRPFNARKAPKGKMPYIDLDGMLMGDSHLIIEELERRRHTAGQKPLDDGLTARARAEGHLVRRTLEEALYFVSVYGRWITDDGFRVFEPELRKSVPAPWLLVPIVRNSVRKKLIAQGTGRHSFEDASKFAIADYVAIAEVLADRPFLLGDAPRTADAALFAFVEGALGFPGESVIKTAVQGHANLVAYRGRMRDKFWTDLPAPV